MYCVLVYFCYREVAHKMLITMCDLNSTYKPWPVYKSHVHTLFEEFYAQVLFFVGVVVAVFYIHSLSCDLHI